MADRAYLFGAYSPLPRTGTVVKETEFWLTHILMHFSAWIMVQTVARREKPTGEASYRICLMAYRSFFVF